MKKATSALAFIAVLLMVAGAAPTQARTAWEDPAGDATGVDDLAPSTPRPSDPQLDIRTASFSVEGDSIVVTTKMEKGGFAVASGGSVWRFYFTHKTGTYFFQALAATPEYSQVFGSTPRFYKVPVAVVQDPTTNGEELKCDCKMVTDVPGGTVKFTIKTASVAKPLKVAPGGIELTKMDVRTYRRAQFYTLTDVAPAPAKATFKA
jgi:hypothetical protein